MRRLKLLLSNKRFFCVLFVAVGSLSLLIVSHAALRGATPGASESRPKTDVTLEMDINKVISSPARSEVFLEGFAGIQAHPVIFSQPSGWIDGYKINRDTTSSDRSVWVNRQSVLSGKNDHAKVNTVDKASQGWEMTGSPAHHTMTGKKAMSPLRPDLDAGINEQKNFLNVHTLSSAGMKSASHAELVAADAPPSPAPEPTTMILVGSGLVFLTTIVRKNFKG